MPAPGRTPLARLHDTAMQLGIIVVDAADDDGPLLDDDTAGFVACGVCIALNPGLDDDGMRADVLAMALALTYTMGPGTTEHAGDITAAGGFVLISRAREAKPGSALGSLATEIAREHGRNTASAAFEYTVPVAELAQRPAGSAAQGSYVAGDQLSDRRRAGHEGRVVGRPLEDRLGALGHLPLRTDRVPDDDGAKPGSLDRGPGGCHVCSETGQRQLAAVAGTGGTAPAMQMTSRALSTCS